MLPNQIHQRPWGTFEIIGAFTVESSPGHDVMVKKITVKPAARLSYQTHRLRKELWVIIQGNGSVTLDDHGRQVTEGDIVVIPANAKHRIGNLDRQLDLVLVEISTGHFDENDIERLEDDFKRV